MTEPPSWPAPSGDQPPPPPAWGQPGQPPTPPPGYGSPPHSQPQYGPQYGQTPYAGQPQYGPPYGQPPYGQPQYGGYPQQPPFQQPYAQAAPKPGIIPLRPLAVSEVLDGAFVTIRRHPKATLGLSAVVACVQQALSLLVRYAAGNLTSSTGLFSRNGDSSSQLGAVYTGLGGTLLISAVLSALLTGVLCLVVSDSILGQPSSAGSAWQRAKPMAWRLVGLSFLAGIGEVFGLAFCLLPGMFLWGAWALAVPALVLERTTVIGALRRSWRLAVPSFWRVWGIRALGWLVAGIITGVLTSVTGFSQFTQAFNNAGNGDVTVHISTLSIVLTSIAAIVGYTVTAPFLAGLLTLLYVDRRIRAEALDVQLQQAAAAGPAVPAAARPF